MSEALIVAIGVPIMVCASSSLGMFGKCPVDTIPSPTDILRRYIDIGTKNGS